MQIFRLEIDYDSLRLDQFRILTGMDRVSRPL